MSTPRSLALNTPCDIKFSMTLQHPSKSVFASSEQNSFVCPNTGYYQLPQFDMLGSVVLPKGTGTNTFIAVNTIPKMKLSDLARCQPEQTGSERWTFFKPIPIFCFQYTLFEFLTPKSVTSMNGFGARLTEPLRSQVAMDGTEWKISPRFYVERGVIYPELASWREER